MNTSDMLDWIAKSSYEDLLRKWRFEQIGSPWFKGEVGAAYRKRMEACRKILSIEDAVAISKRVGWSQGINPRDFKEHD